MKAIANLYPTIHISTPHQLGSGAIILPAPRADDGLIARASTSIAQRLRKLRKRFMTTRPDVQVYGMYNNDGAQKTVAC